MSGSLGTPLHFYTKSVILSGDDFASSLGAVLVVTTWGAVLLASSE